MDGLRHLILGVATHNDVLFPLVLDNRGSPHRVLGDRRLGAGPGRRIQRSIDLIGQRLVTYPALRLLGEPPGCGGLLGTSRAGKTHPYE